MAICNLHYLIELAKATGTLLSQNLWDESNEQKWDTLFEPLILIDAKRDTQKVRRNVISYPITRIRNDTAYLKYDWESILTTLPIKSR